MFRNSSISGSSSTGSGPYRRFVAAFVSGAAALLAPGVMLSLFLQPIKEEDGLARVGFLVARDFHAQLPEPTLKRLDNGAHITAPEILVLGDSFSNNNVWQSEVSRLTGARTLTYLHEDVECIDDWIRKAVSGNLRSSARVVVVESVEREFLSRFSAPSNCLRNYYRPTELPAEVSGGSRSPWAIFPMDIRHVMKSALRYNDIHHAAGRLKSGKTVLVDLVRDDLFSNTLSHRLAYFIGDEAKFAQWDNDMAERTIKRLTALRTQAASRGITLHFLVLPDKSSVYFPYIKPDQQQPYDATARRLFALLAEHMGPEYDLLTSLQEWAPKIKDLYRPDDTHLSVRGYTVLAEKVSGWIREPLIPQHEVRLLDKIDEK